MPRCGDVGRLRRCWTSSSLADGELPVVLASADGATVLFALLLEMPRVRDRGRAKAASGRAVVYGERAVCWVTECCQYS